MKIETVFSEQKVEGTDVEKTSMSLSEHASAMVFKMFTSNIYSNPIGTIVREITSNSFDSHIEAGVDDPVIIRKTIDNETGTHYVSFIDRGVGMSPERIKNVYSVYFESTKRDENTQIGGFGIGGKTPLAYKRKTGNGENDYDNSFSIITIFDGVKYYYTIHEEKNSPAITLLYKEPTQEHNGTEVRVPVLQSDLRKFEKEMVRQLYYFENVIFEGFDLDEESSFGLTNDYKIVKGKSFWYRGHEYNRMHVCLGRVAYPIDYSILELNEHEFNIPVAIKLEIGDLNVTANREQLDYNEKTIKLLKKKLVEVKEELLHLFEESLDNVQTLEDYYDLKSNFGKLYLHPDVPSIFLGAMFEPKDLKFPNFKYNDLKIPTADVLFYRLFVAKGYGKISNPNGRYQKHPKYLKPSFDDIKNYGNLYYSENFVRKNIKSFYLKENHERYYIIQKRNLSLLEIRTILMDVFRVSLKELPDQDAFENSKYHKIFLEIQDEYFEYIKKNTISYDDLEVPDDFNITYKKRNVTNNVLNKNIIVHFHSPYSRKAKVKFKEIFNFKNKIFYGENHESNLLYKSANYYDVLFNQYIVNDKGWQSLTCRKHGENSYQWCTEKPEAIMFVSLSPMYIKYLKKLPNAYHVSEFKDMLLKRKRNSFIKTYQNNFILSKYNELSKFIIDKNTPIKHLNERWYDMIVDVNYKIEKIKTATTPNSEVIENLDTFLSVFDLTEKQLNRFSPEQKELLKNIEKLKRLYEKNQETIMCLDMPYSYENISDKMIEILKKIIIFTR